MRWFKITEYGDKCAITTVKLVETTWLTRHPCPTETTYDKGLECIGHKFRKYLTEK